MPSARLKPTTNPSIYGKVSRFHFFLAYLPFRLVHEASCDVAFTMQQFDPWKAELQSSHLFWCDIVIQKWRLLSRSVFDQLKLVKRRISMDKLI